MTRVTTPAFLSCLHNEDIDHWHILPTHRPACGQAINQPRARTGHRTHTPHTHTHAHTPGENTGCIKFLQNDSTSGGQSQNGNEAFQCCPMTPLTGTRHFSDSLRPMMRILESDDTNLALIKTIMASVALTRLLFQDCRGRNNILHY